MQDLLLGTRRPETLLPRGSRRSLIEHKEKGKEFFDREKKAKDAAKDMVNEVAGKIIDRFVPGGDNKPAKAVADAVIHKDSWWKAAAKVFFTSSETGESQFTQPLQQVKNAPVVPANSSNDVAGTITHIKSTPVVPAGPSNENALIPQQSPSSMQAAPPAVSSLPRHEGDGLTGSQRDPTPTLAGNSTPQQSDASANMSAGQSKQIMLEAGKTTWAQADHETNFNPKPELATGSTGQNGSTATPSAPPSTPAAAATPAPAPTATPTPPVVSSGTGIVGVILGMIQSTVKEAQGGGNGGSGGSGPFGIFSGKGEIFGSTLGGSVGVTTVNPGHDPSSHPDHPGHSEPPGHFVGPDHPSPTARDTA